MRSIEKHTVGLDRVAYGAVEHESLGQGDLQTLHTPAEKECLQLDAHQGDQHITGRWPLRSLPSEEKPLTDKNDSSRAGPYPTIELSFSPGEPQQVYSDY